MVNAIEDHVQGEGRSVRVRTAIELLQRLYTDPKLRLGTVAASLRVSGHHLSHLIKKETGRGFRQHLTHVRIRQAQHLLLNSHMIVKEIAVAVGYDSTSSFDREFRRINGRSPTEWRREAQTV